MSGLGDGASVVVDGCCAAVGLAGGGGDFGVVVDGESELVADEAAFDEMEGDGVGHFLDDDACLVGGVGVLQHLSAAEGVGLRAVALDVGDGDGFPPPGVVDDEFGVDAEEFVQFVFVGEGLSGEHSHREDFVAFESSGDAVSDAPEVGEGSVVPECAAVAHFVEFGDAHAVAVGGYVLGDDVHSDFGEVEVGADACGSGDACFAQHVAYHCHCELVGCHLVGAEVVGGVDEDFVYGVDVNVFGGDVAEVDLVDASAVLDVVSHSWRCGDVVDGQFGMGFELVVVGRLAAEAVAGSVELSVLVDFAQSLHDFEEACAASDAVGFECWRDGEADGLLGARGVGHHEVGGERIEPTFGALDGGIERFEVDGDICAHAGHLGGGSLKFKV